MSMGLVTTSAFASGTWTFHKVATIHLKGPKGHGDLGAFDPHNNRIFLSMPTGVDVVSTVTNKVIKYFPHIQAPNGEVVYKGYDYVAEGPGPGHVNALVVIGADSLKNYGQVKTQGTSPDGIAIDRDNGLLYVGCDDNNWVEVYNLHNPAKPKYVTKYMLYPSHPKAGPDVGTVVSSMGYLFWSDDSFIDKINANTGTLDGHVDTGVKLLKHGGTKAEYYNHKDHRLWTVTTNKAPGVIISDPDTLKVVKTIPESGGGDDGEPDAALGLFYVFSSSSKGFDVYNMNNLTHVTHVRVGIGTTHSGVVDTNNHVVYAYGGAKAELVGYKPIRK